MTSLATRYKEAVNECKGLVKFRNDLKYEIVKKALSVCVIKEGNSSSYQLYTLTAFAKDIGVPYGTLSRWKMEYESVIEKVDLKKDEKVNRYALDETMRKVKKDTPKEEVKKIYTSFQKGLSNPEDKTMVDYLRRIKSMKFFICYSADISKLDKKMIQEMKECMKEMVAVLETGVSKKTKTKVIKKAVREARVMMKR